ncbi:glycosyltransferase family 2 protein [Candidatus Falkowbacteria bacterium]|nr:glycosyltransferase family 2 protein [Candidatus Falkowbacteria bacterium]
MMPKISIIIPTYQHGDAIETCLLSLFNQTFKDFEIIVVNDGSTDNTSEILEKYKDRVKIINQENRGAPAARNRGFRESVGQFIIFADADVKAKPEMLAKMFQALEKHPEASYAYSSFMWGRKKFGLHEFDGEALKKMNYITSTTLIRREHFPGWDESFKKFQDWDLWLTMLEQDHTGVWVPEFLFDVIDTKATMSRWLPSFMYKIPWEKIGWAPKAIKKYNVALKIIKEKHRL